MASGELGGKQSALTEQLAAARELRGKGAPQGTYAGGTYVSANPLEHLARGLEGRRARKDIDRIGEEQQALLGQQTAANKSFLDLLRGKQKGPMGGPGPSGPAGMGGGAPY